MKRQYPDHLHLLYATDSPEGTDFDVKQTATGELLGHDAVFNVIGDSHHISVPELEYHELVSCIPQGDSPVRTYPLTDGLTDTVNYAMANVTVTTEIQARPLDEFPGPEAFDIAYRFDEAAYTTINHSDTDRYETYHTYPEYRIAFRTRTVLTLQTDSAPHHSTTDSDWSSDPSETLPQ